MSIKTNTIANYVGQLYMAIMAVAIVPFYIERMGIEGYGLVGMFAMVQGWMQLLDMGISASISRESAKARISHDNAKFYKQFQSLVIILFLFIALVVIGVGIFLSPYIVHRWLNTNLSDSITIPAFICIILTVSLRWQCSPLRSALQGLERQVYINVVNIIVVTLRFPCSLVVLDYFNNSLVHYFIYQSFIAVVELTLFLMLVKRFSPFPEKVKVFNRVFLAEVKPTLRFAMGAATTSAIWVFISQLDKLILSGLIPLHSYGYFTMAISAAGCISILSGPLGQAVSPRLTSLYSRGERVSMLRLYRQATRYMAMIIIPVATMLGFADEAVYVWAGDWGIARSVGPILRWYAWGNGLLALSAFVYYLQCAYGSLRFHIIGNLFFSIVLIPSIYLSAKYFGTLGTARVWFVQNAVYLLLWLLLFTIS